ncbi:MAG: hypothetical protein ACRDH1_06005, partial [Actinomycetota bacterium]
SPPHRTGLFAVRAWIDPARPEAFTARVTWSADVSRNEEVEISKATVEGLEAALRDWLRAFLPMHRLPREEEDHHIRPRPWTE